MGDICLIKRKETGRMEGRTEGQKEGRTEGQTEGRTEEGRKEHKLSMGKNNGIITTNMI
jgi:hypothetical protein